MRSRPEPNSIDLARGALLRAIDRRDETRSGAEEAGRLAAGRPELAKWSALAWAAAVEADRSLVLAILATGSDFGEGDVRDGAQQDRWPARGARLGGKLYLVLPHPDRDDDDGGDGTDLMRLAIVEAGRILDFDLDRPVAAAGPEAEGPIVVEPSPPTPAVTSDDHRMIAGALGLLGRDETFERLYLAGPYRVIADVVGRLGTDAVAELRRMLAAGTRDREIIARAAEGLATIELDRLARIAGGAEPFDGEAAEIVRRAIEGIERAGTALAEAG